MPAPSRPSPPIPLAHGPAAVIRAERTPRAPWRGALAASLLVVAGAVCLHGDARWLAATQVAGLVWAARLAAHPSPPARGYAAWLVAAVVLADLIGAALPALSRW